VRPRPCRSFLTVEELSGSEAFLSKGRYFGIPLRYRVVVSSERFALQHLCPARILQAGCYPVGVGVCVCFCEEAHVGEAPAHLLGVQRLLAVALDYSVQGSWSRAYAHCA